MALFNLDLKSREGAARAMKIGANACLLLVVFVIVRWMLDWNRFEMTDNEKIGYAAGSLLKISMALVADSRLRKGSGAFWAAACLIVFGLDIVGQFYLADISTIWLPLVGVVLWAMLLVGTLGAFAVRKLAGSSQGPGVYN